MLLSLTLIIMLRFIHNLFYNLLLLIFTIFLGIFGNAHVHLDLNLTSGILGNTSYWNPNTNALYDIVCVFPALRVDARLFYMACEQLFLSEK